MNDQLDIFREPAPEPRDDDEPDEVIVVQLTELPGTTFEDIFGDAA